MGACATEAAADGVRKVLLSLRGCTVQGGPRADGRGPEVNLKLRAGEAVAIVGRSGAGKSTLVEALFGLRRDCIVSGEASITRDAVLLTQDDALFEDLSARGNVRIVARHAGGAQGRGGVERRVRRALEMVGLDALPEKREVAHLSGGQRRRVAIARALARRADLFVFDEPAAGLDAATIEELAGTLRSACIGPESGLLVVTHSLLLATAAADRVYVMNEAGLEEVPAAPDCDHDGAAAAGRVVALERPILAALRRTVPAQPVGAHTERSGLQRILGSPAVVLDLLGDHIVQAVVVLRAVLPGLRHPRDFGRSAAIAFWLAALSGLFFYGIVGAVMGLMTIVVLKISSGMPMQESLQLVRGSFLGALTPPIAGFLFCARSGSAICAWLGGQVRSKQTDAMRLLGIDPDTWLRTPAFLATALSHLVVSAAFMAAMWAGAAATAALAFSVEGALELLRPSWSDAEIRRATIRSGVYALLLAGAIVRHGFTPKRTSADVARSITWAIMEGCVLVTFGEAVARLLQLKEVIG